MNKQEFSASSWRSSQGYILRESEKMGLRMTFRHEGDGSIIRSFIKGTLYHGARSGAVGWGTALQAGKSRVRFPTVSLKFFQWHNPSRPHYGPGVDSTSDRNKYQEYFLGVKAAGAKAWQTYHLHVPTVSKSESLKLLEPSGPVQACNGIALPVTLYFISLGFSN